MHGLSGNYDDYYPLGVSSYIFGLDMLKFFRNSKLVLQVVLLLSGVANLVAEPHITDQRFLYEVSWQGIPAGEISLGSEAHHDSILLRTSVRTNSYVDMFYTLRYEGTASIDSNSFSPRWVKLVHTENSKVKITNLQFGPDGVQARNLKLGKEWRTRTIAHDKEVLGPFSAAFKTRMFDWEVGKRYTVKAFNGRGLYSIEFRAVAEDWMRSRGRLRPVWIIEPQVVNLDKGARPSKLKQARIYLTRDDQREILLIESEVFIGKVLCRLISAE